MVANEVNPSIPIVTNTADIDIVMQISIRVKKIQSMSFRTDQNGDKSACIYMKFTTSRFSTLKIFFSL